MMLTRSSFLESVRRTLTTSWTIISDSMCLKIFSGVVLTSCHPPLACSLNMTRMPLLQS